MRHPRVQSPTTRSCPSSVATTPGRAWCRRTRYGCSCLRRVWPPPRSRDTQQRDIMAQFRSSAGRSSAYSKKGGISSITVCCYFLGETPFQRPLGPSHANDYNSDEFKYDIARFAIQEDSHSPAGRYSASPSRRYWGRSNRGRFRFGERRAGVRKLGAASLNSPKIIGFATSTIPPSPCICRRRRGHRRRGCHVRRRVPPVGLQSEGDDPARDLQGLGIAAFVLKYRLAREEARRTRSKSIREKTGSRPCAVRRSRAQEWGVDQKNRIGIMGFSAGGELFLGHFHSSRWRSARGRSDRPASARPRDPDVQGRWSCHRRPRCPAFLAAADDDACCSEPVKTVSGIPRSQGSRGGSHLCTRRPRLQHGIPVQTGNTEGRLADGRPIAASPSLMNTWAWSGERPREEDHDLWRACWCGGLEF